VVVEVVICERSAKVKRRWEKEKRESDGLIVHLSQLFAFVQ
jgi:hypothetical protein